MISDDKIDENNKLHEARSGNILSSRRKTVYIISIMADVYSITFHRTNIIVRFMFRSSPESD